MTAAGRPRGFDRDEVLEQAMGLFWQKGYEGTSKRELMDATGVASQSLYNAFGTKRELFLSSLQHYVDTRMQFLRSVLEASGSALERLRRYVGLWQGVPGEAGFENGCMMCNTLAEFGRSDPEIQELLLERMQASQAMIAKVVGEAREAGELAAHTDPVATAAMLVSATFGVSLMHRMGAGDEQLGQVTAGALALLESLR